MFAKRECRSAATREPDATAIVCEPDLRCNGRDHTRTD